jgi:hypothetical protein
LVAAVVRAHIARAERWRSDLPSAVRVFGEALADIVLPVEGDTTHIERAATAAYELGVNRGR